MKSTELAIYLRKCWVSQFGRLVLPGCAVFVALICSVGCYVPIYHRPHGFSDTSDRRFATAQPMAADWQGETVDSVPYSENLPPAPADIDPNSYGPDLLPVPVEPKQVPAEAMDDHRTPVDMLPQPPPSAKRNDNITPTSALSRPPTRKPRKHGRWLPTAEKRR